MKRKGTFIDFNYLVLILMFFVVFTTGLALASESFDSISEITGVKPPSELKACQNFKSYEQSVLFQKGTENVGWFEGIKEFHYYQDDVLVATAGRDYDRLDPSEPNKSVVLWSLIGDAGSGTWREEKYPYYLDVRGTAIVNKIEVYSWTPPGTSINITLKDLKNMTEGSYSWTYTIDETVRDDFIGETTIDLSDSDVVSDNVVVNDDVDFEFVLDRSKNDFESPRLSYVKVYGEYIEFDTNFFDDALSTVGCAFAQITNLASVATLQTGYKVLDVVLIPLQFLLLIIGFKLLSEFVSSLPFT